MERIEFRAMGCQMLAVLDVTAESEAESRRVRRLLEQAPGWFAGWEQSLSRFRPDSELMRINQQMGAWVKVSDTIWDVLQLAIGTARKSNGLIVPTILPALEATGYDRSFDLMMVNEGESQAGPANPSQVAGSIPSLDDREQWREIEMDVRTRRVRLPQDTRLDLGGIAKGWAADQAARRLGLYGPALVDAGGDIAISSLQRNGEKWPIEIATPVITAGATASAMRNPATISPDNQDYPLPLLVVGRGGVATSGKDYRRWRHDGMWQHHIINPRTGRPADTDVLSVTVVAPTTHQAEWAAKMILILGSRAGMAWLDLQPGLAGLMILDAKPFEVVSSRNVQDYIWR